MLYLDSEAHDAKLHKPVTCGMRTTLHAFDGHLVHIAFLPDSSDEAGWLEAWEQGFMRAAQEQLRLWVNAALVEAGWSQYRMQLYQGRRGDYYVFAISPAPQPTGSVGA